MPVIVWPSADIVAWPSTAIEQDDIMPLKPLVGTLMWKLSVFPLTVPVMLPLPIIPRPVSLKLIVPERPLPFWVTVQPIVSCPVVSRELPDQAPVMLVNVGETGDVVLFPPHAATAKAPKSARTTYRIAYLQERPDTRSAAGVWWLNELD